MSDVVGVEVVRSDVVGVVEKCQRRSSEKVRVVDAAAKIGGTDKGGEDERRRTKDNVK